MGAAEGTDAGRALWPILWAMLIRSAVPADVPAILRLIAELAEYEKAPGDAKATAAQMHRALFGIPAVDGPGAGVAECVMAEHEGKAAGFALWFTNFSTWTGAPGMYLEDLFVRPEFRRLGIGRALLAHLARIAVKRGYQRFEWSVLDWNTPAIEFYRSIGAVQMSEWTVHRLSGRALGALAARSSQA